MSHPLYIAILWHMHQPDYRDPATGILNLPWVRLHAAKDYLHMAEVLAQHPEVHVTVNFTPVLLEQLDAYAQGKAEDRLMLLSRQTSWTEEERAYLLNVGFSIHWHNVIQRYPPYWALLQRRAAALENPNEFTDQEYRDLLAWVQLAWTDPNRLEQDEVLRRLVEKGREFTMDELELIIARHREMCAQVVPLYRKLAERGQVELTTSPYAHPVLPLLVDSAHARRATPGLPIPEPSFQAREDVLVHLQMALECHERFFEQRPLGLWPSEGAVSQEVVEAIGAVGFQWLASDEAILGRCLGRWFQRDSQDTVTNPQALYQPYLAMIGNRPGPTLIFRDHVLSDRIGFIYQHIPGEQAAEDLIIRLQIIRRRLADEHRPYLVSIILDGENCWDGYEHNGDVFLHSLYRRLSRSSELRTVTVSEYLRMNPPRGMLARIATGSWINGDLTTWIGDPKHIQAWSLLRDTRAFLVAFETAHPDLPTSVREEAWRAIYKAEGSDWFWWYSERNISDQEALFDTLFRRYLAHVYRVLNQPIPEQLMQPIFAQQQALVQKRGQRQYLTPTLSADPDPTREWGEALSVQSVASAGAMQQAGHGLRALRVAYDANHLYLRLETFKPLSEMQLEVLLQQEDGQQSRITWHPERPLVKIHGQTLGSQEIERMALGDRVLEVAIPFSTVGIRLGARLRLQGSATNGSEVINRVPADQPLELFLSPLSSVELSDRAPLPSRDDQSNLGP
jgi:alpha-amylase/alpha-mannosidase (GH57 family)